MTNIFRGPRWRRVAALMAAVAAIALFGHTPGHAQEIGFAYSSDPTGPLHNYNSSGGAIKVKHTGTGAYRVTFAGLGDGLFSNVQVNAIIPQVGANAQVNGKVFCMTPGWGAINGKNAYVDVRCYDSTGAPQDASEGFKVLYQARHRNDAAMPVIAFLWANQPTADHYKPDTSYQFSSEGSKATITRTGTGDYTVKLPLMTAVHGTALVTPYGDTPAHCAVMHWAAKGTGVVLKVACTDVTGAPLDVRFSLVYSASATAGYGGGTPNGAAILADKPRSVKPYTPDPDFSISMGSAPMQVLRTGTGIYRWSLTADQPWGASTVFATPYSAPGNSCSGQAGDKPPKAVITVTCFDVDGQPADTSFTATFQTSNGN